MANMTDSLSVVEETDSGSISFERSLLGRRRKPKVPCSVADPACKYVCKSTISSLAGCDELEGEGTGACAFTVEFFEACEAIVTGAVYEACYSAVKAGSHFGTKECKKAFHC